MEDSSLVILKKDNEEKEKEIILFKQNLELNYLIVIISLKQLEDGF